MIVDEASDHADVQEFTSCLARPNATSVCRNSGAWVKKWRWVDLFASDRAFSEVDGGNHRANGKVAKNAPRDT